MNVLDENIIENQCQLLKNWRISFRQIGTSLGQQGFKNRKIITLLHELNNPIFFTRDDDFYDPKLCHSGYCIVFLNVKKGKVAPFIRRFLHYNKFGTAAKRMGSVVKISHTSLSVWRLHSEKQIRFNW